MGENAICFMKKKGLFCLCVLKWQTNGIFARNQEEKETFGDIRSYACCKEKQLSFFNDLIVRLWGQGICYLC